MRYWVAILATLCLVSLRADACWQMDQNPIVIKAMSLNGRAIDHDRPYSGLRFELHRAITFDREERWKTGIWNPEIFKSTSLDREEGPKRLWKPEILKVATADSSGLFSFGEVPPGRYWVVLGRGSMNFAVELVDSNGKPPYKRLFYNSFADGCEELKVEDTR